MKVASTRTAGLRTAVAVVSVVATVVAALTGSGAVPPRRASAMVVEIATERSGVLAEALPLAEEEPKADELRTPSGIEQADAKASGRRTPTTVRKAARVRSSAPVAAASGGWQTARVSWYGPGFYGNTMAGGGTLTPTSMVVAHRSLPFGTRIEFSYKGRSCVAVVRDRGPYVGGRVFDLGPGTAKALGFSGVGTVRYRILGR